MKIFLSVLLSSLFVIGVSFAEDAEQLTQDILETTIDRSVDILADTSTSSEQKQALFDVLLQDVCQTDLMSKLVLGRDGWTAFSEEQRQEFVDLFIQVLTRSYYKKMELADLSTVEISYTGNEELSPRKRKLKTVIADSLEGYRVDYMFALIDEQWGIYDMSIDGISLLTSYRSQFSDYLKQNSALDLLEMLRQRAAESE